MTDVTHMANPAYDLAAPAPPAGNMVQDPAVGAAVGAMIAIPMLIANPAAPGQAAGRAAALDELRYMWGVETKKIQRDRERYDAGVAAFFKIVSKVVGAHGHETVIVESNAGDPKAVFDKWILHGEPVEVASRGSLMDSLGVIRWEDDESLDNFVNRKGTIYRLLLTYPDAVDIDDDMKKSRLFSCINKDRRRGPSFAGKISAICNPIDSTLRIDYEASKTILIKEEQNILARGGYHGGESREKSYARAAAEETSTAMVPFVAKSTAADRTDRAALTCFIPNCGGNHSAKDCPDGVECGDCGRHYRKGTKCGWKKCPGKTKKGGGSGKSGGGASKARVASQELTDVEFYSDPRIELAFRAARNWPTGKGSKKSSERYYSSADNSDYDTDGSN